jgi:integrase
VGHIQDRWWKEFGKDERGKPRRVKTPDFGTGMWYRVRYLDLNGVERSKSFPDRQKGAAEAFLHEIENDKNKGTYLDPSAGRMPFRQFGEKWLAAQTFDESTRDVVEVRLRIHVYPYLGDIELRAIGPSTIQGWVRQLQQRGLAETYRRTIFANVSGIFTAAIDDERIRRNPCAARSVTRPRGEYPKVVPWTPARVSAVREALGERYRLALSLGAGCGMRQGEVFGLSLDDIDEEGQVIHVVRQLKLMRGRFVFALPKQGRVRDIPLPDSVKAALRTHIERYPPLTMTFP